MPVPSKIAQLTVSAYLETDYCVGGNTPFVMHVGIANDNLARLYKQFQTNSAALITACNPYSKKVGDLVNAERNAKLESELTRRSLTFWDGVGKHPSGNWPEEPGYFVLSLSLQATKMIGKKYEQNAIIWCGADTIPELILLR